MIIAYLTIDQAGENPCFNDSGSIPSYSCVAVSFYILFYIFTFYFITALLDRVGGVTLTKFSLRTRHTDAHIFFYFLFIYLTSVVPSVPTRLLSMEADGAPSIPPTTVSAPF